MRLAGGLLAPPPPWLTPGSCAVMAGGPVVSRHGGVEIPMVSWVVGVPGVETRGTANNPEGSLPSVVDAISDVPSVDAISGRSIR